MEADFRVPFPCISESAMPAHASFPIAYFLAFSHVSHLPRPSNMQISLRYSISKFQRQITPSSHLNDQDTNLKYLNLSSLSLEADQAVSTISRMDYSLSSKELQGAQPPSTESPINKTQNLLSVVTPYLNPGQVVPTSTAWFHYLPAPKTIPSRVNAMLCAPNQASPSIHLVSPPIPAKEAHLAPRSRHSLELQLGYLKQCPHSQFRSRLLHLDFKTSRLQGP